MGMQLQHQMCPQLFWFCLLLLATHLISTSAEPHMVTPAPGDTTRHPSAEGHQCLRQIQRKIIAQVDPFLRHFSGKVALIDVAVHTNVGDNMLWLAAKRLLAYYGRTPDVMCAGAQYDPMQPNFPKCTHASKMLRQLGNPALFFYHAGGNFGDLYAYVQDARNTLMRELDKELRTNPEFRDWNVTFVHLPQSMFYKNTTLIARDRRLYASFKRLKVHFMVRSRYGMDVVGPALRQPTIPAPDLVYYLGPQQTLDDPIWDILLIIRQDAESAFNSPQVVELAKRMLAPTGLTFAVDDWPIDPNVHTNHVQGIPADLAEIRLYLGIKMLSSAKLLLTNRLHSSVLAELLGIPVIHYNSDGVSGYNKVQECISLARSVSQLCTDESLRSWEAKAPQGGTEEQAVTLALQQAIHYFKNK